MHTLRLTLTRRLLLTCALLFTVGTTQASVFQDFDAPLDDRFFSFSDAGPIPFSRTDPDGAGIDAIPGKPGDDAVLGFSLSDGALSGVGENFANPVGGSFPVSQDWSDFTGFSFWFHGAGVGNAFSVSLLDTNTTSGGELWLGDFQDDTRGWQEITIDFSDFYLAPYATLNDGVLNLSSIYSWVIVAGGANGVLAGDYYLDDLALVPAPSPLALLLVAALGASARRKATRRAR